MLSQRKPKDCFSNKLYQILKEEIKLILENSKRGNISQFIFKVIITLILKSVKDSTKKITSYSYS